MTKPQPSLRLHQYLVGPDNIHVRYGVYGRSRRSKHIIVFLLGRGEWIEKYSFLYARFYDEFRRSIVILDHMGQGGSGGVPSHINSYDEYVSALCELLASEFAGRSYSIVAHSMGGLIALYGLCRDRIHPTRVMLSSPLIGLPQKPIPRLIAKPISRLFTESSLGQLSSFVKPEYSYMFIRNRLTSDKEKYQLIKNNPYAIPPPTLSWVAASFAACELIHYDRYLMHLDVPILVMYGGDEEVVCAKSIVSWTRMARRLSTSTVDVVCVPSAKHELFFENDAIFESVFSKTKSFLVQDPFMKSTN